MGWLQFLIFVTGFVGFVIYIGSVFISAKWSVRRQIEIAATPDSIFAVINDIRTWPEWNTGNSVGDIRLTESRPPQGVKYQILNEGGLTPVDGIILIKPTPSGSEVYWECRGNSGGNPIRKYFNLGKDRSLGSDFESGLSLLKTRMEGQK